MPLEVFNGTVNLCAGQLQDMDLGVEGLEIQPCEPASPRSGLAPAVDELGINHDSTSLRRSLLHFHKYIRVGVWQHCLEAMHYAVLSTVQPNLAFQR